MGSGKSQAAIAFMNAHPERKFIYLSPYLPEAERIYKECPALQFVKPGDIHKDKKISKVKHTRSLLSAGRNVASTHAAFCLYSDDMIELIQRHDYTLIIDESITTLTDVKEEPGDIELLEFAGCIRPVEGEARYELGDVEYRGVKHRDVIDMCQRNNLLCITNSEDENTSHTFYYWELRSNILQSFSEVFILTYLWAGQEIKYFLDAQAIPYDFIGIRRNGDQYAFAEAMEYYPDYIGQLREMMSICTIPGYNEIGNDRNALSVSWYKNATDAQLHRMKCNMRNFVRDRCRAKTCDAMYTCFKDNADQLKQYGIGIHIPCNLRASNDYRERTVLCYPVNIFCNPMKKRYLSSGEQTFDENLYALSILIQWIWRSAIRDGKPIRLYIPSRRMRSLLTQWIEDTMQTYAAHLESVEESDEIMASHDPAVSSAA